MLASRYLNAFQVAVKENDNDHTLYGSCLWVERIPEEEVKTASGLYIPQTTSKSQIGTITSDKPFFVHVLAVGAGHYNEETGEDVPLSVAPGDVILIGTSSVKWFSYLEIDNYEPYSIGLTLESEVQIKYEGREAYQRFFNSINSAIKKQVQGSPL